MLYRVAALPDEIAATLTPDTLLTDPRTGKQTALREMSARTLAAVLLMTRNERIPAAGS